MGDLVVFLVGAFFGGAGVFWLVRWLAVAQPALAVRLRLAASGPTYELLDGQPAPAVDPTLSGVLTLTREEVQAGGAKKLPDEELKRLVELLAGDPGRGNGWVPRKHQDEYRFQESFERFLLEHGYSEDDVQPEAAVSWRAAEGAIEKRHARPDFIVRRRVLVEIKRNLTASGASDRALGQMLRYLVAWADKGPALLLVCNECDGHLRALIKRYVRSWQAQGVPVMAYFVRTDSHADAIADLPVK
jgi:hypothetical protein